MQSEIYKITMRNGLFMGVLFSVNFLFSASRSLPLMLLTYVIIAFIIAATYRMATRFRDRELGGFISYWKAVYFVLLTFFFGGIVSALFKIGYTSFINTGYLPQLFEEGVRQIEQNRALFESLKMPMDENYYEQLERQFRPAPYAFQTIWTNLLAGGVLGLIVGGIVRRRRGLFDSDVPEQNPDQEL
ncbi:MAG: DUF4199 domain-containing protein [Bacteroidales bacterium]|jgi:hypothetical protein|nr:DUF4199 domain-containing protein [Bacteroidales bacterium]OJX91952.1 MAG: hypothetical protein BGP01_06630 [Paludibacter sp. 47-17]